MKQTKKLLRLGSLAILVFTVVVALKVTNVHALDNDFSDGITVDSKLDTADDNVGDGICDDGSGNCTLRAAIEEANNDSDASVITFNITGTSDFQINGHDGFTIDRQNDFQAITEPLTINGYSQPGASANSGLIGQPFNGTVLIKIDGTNTTGANLGLQIKATDVEVKGLSIVSTTAGLVIEDADGVQVSGMLIGLSPDGSATGNNQAGIVVIDSTDVTIGGGAPAVRNVISYNDLLGYGNGQSILTQPSGPTTSMSGLVVQGNYLGTGLNGKADPSEVTKNASGVILQGVGDGTLIGGVQPQQANIISGVRGVGVGVISYSLSGIGAALIPQKVSILGNKISAVQPRDISGNGGPNFVGLGVDLGGLEDTSNPPDGPDVYDLGITQNDADDLDTGANNYINFPVLNSVSQKDDQTTINFNLDAADSPTNQYRIELFANDTADETGYGEGQTFLGALTVSNGDNQQATLTLPAGLNIVGKSITATTTAVDSSAQSGFGATSEFAKNVVAVAHSNATLAQTGANITLLSLIGLCLTLVTGSVILQRKFSKS